MLLFFILFIPSILGEAENDLMKNIPGVTFQVNFKTYSGYLNAGNNGSWRMHYILHESQSNPDTDPVLLWLEGGPGCSSLGTLFEQLGPFYANYDGKSLFENPYAWNKKANLLALESPTGVGFSYNTAVKKDIEANDDRSRDQNYNAMKEFFKVHSRFANRTFFISGESYAGVYVPMLAARIIQGINEGDFPNPNFQGAAIGNGWMNSQILMNSLVVWSAYHGLISPANWKKIKEHCVTPGANHSDDYNYEAYMYTTNGLDFYGDHTVCGRLINPLITDEPAGPLIYVDQYNFYQDCYDFSLPIGRKKRNVSRKKGMPKKRVYTHPANDKMGGYTDLGENTALLFNHDSSDSEWGYPCWNDDAAQRYFNRKEIQDAWNIEPGWAAQGRSIKWQDCSDPMYNAYNQTYPDMTPFFDTIIKNNKQKGFRILVYNGDVDMVCNFLGDSWFIENLATSYGVDGGVRAPWLFAQQMAGYNQRYDFGNLTIDVLTVKGAGHLVEVNRPGPSLQMIVNFMWPFGTGSDYSSESQIKAKPKLAPFLNDATTTAPSRTTRVIINATTTTKKQQATTVFHGNSPVISDGTTTQGIVSANDSTSTTPITTSIPSGTGMCGSEDLPDDTSSEAATDSECTSEYTSEYDSDTMPSWEPTATSSTEEMPVESQQLVNAFEKIINDKIKEGFRYTPRLKETHDDLVPRRTPDFLVPQQHSFSHVTLQAGAQTKQPSTCKLPDNLLAQRVQELLQRAANARQEGISSQLPPQLQQKYFEEALTPKEILHFVCEHLPNNNKKIYGLVRFNGEVDAQYIELDILVNTMPELMLKYLRQTKK